MPPSPPPPPLPGGEGGARMVAPWQSLQDQAAVARGFAGRARPSGSSTPAPKVNRSLNGGAGHKKALLFLLPRQRSMVRRIFKGSLGCYITDGKPGPHSPGFGPSLSQSIRLTSADTSPAIKPETSRGRFCATFACSSCREMEAASAGQPPHVRPRQSLGPCRS